VYRAGNDFGLIPAVKIETRHPIEGNLVTNFCRSIVIVELWRPEVARLGKIVIYAFFGKTTLYGKIFYNSVPKVFIATLIDMLFSNFVKFGRREIGKIVRCLPDKNTKIRLALQLSLLRPQRLSNIGGRVGLTGNM